LLESEWQPEKRPRETKISSQVFDSCVGQYQLSPDFALGTFVMQALLMKVPKAIIWIPAGICLAAIFILLWCVANWLVLSCAALLGGLLSALSVLALSWVVCALCHPTLGIRREGDRLFVQYDLRLAPVTGKFITPAAAKALPHITGELLPESETRFFGRTTGMPVTFSRDDRGKVIRLITYFLGATFSYAKISDQPPKACAPLKPRVAIKLDTKLLDACAGYYELAPPGASAPGINVTIWREGDQLLWQARGRNVVPGPFNVYPESPTNFFLKISGGQLTFNKNDKGEVAFSLQDDAWLPDGVGKKLKSK